MTISRRSFEECVDTARSLAEEKPFTGGWGNSGYSEMQSLSSYFPKQLPEITERGNLSMLSFLSFPLYLHYKKELGTEGNSFLLKLETFA